MLRHQRARQHLPRRRTRGYISTLCPCLVLTVNGPPPPPPPPSPSLGTKAERRSVTLRSSCTLQNLCFVLQNLFFLPRCHIQHHIIFPNLHLVMNFIKVSATFSYVFYTMSSSFKENQGLKQNKQRLFPAISPYPFYTRSTTLFR